MGLKHELSQDSMLAGLLTLWVAGWRRCLATADGGAAGRELGQLQGEGGRDTMASHGQPQSFQSLLQEAGCCSVRKQPSNCCTCRPALPLETKLVAPVIAMVKRF